ncbi:28S Rrna (Cytosine-C(5))-Methyltransferase [Manis pentadactyla]|nr:28S Rrna (Cytosine-C(5))-Methyltransferase [Manis pentadactyla]
MESHQGSIKGLVYGSRFQNVKQLYALVCKTQRYSAVLDAVITSADLLDTEKKLQPHLAKVLVYELLLGRDFREGGGRWKPLLEWHQPRLKAELARLKVHGGDCKYIALILRTRKGMLCGNHPPKKINLYRIQTDIYKCRPKSLIEKREHIE